MALTLEAIVLVKERARLESRKPGPAEALRSLWKHMQQLQNPDLKIKFFSDLKTADVVVSDAACKLYAIFFAIPSTATVDSWLKGSNHATTAAANGDVTFNSKAASTAGKQYCPVFHDGLPMSAGLTLGSHTAVNGNTKSENVDAATGFAIVGAA